MNTKPTSLLATKTLTRNKVLVLFALALWCLMLVIGAACRTSAPEAPPRTELAAAPGSCAPVAFPTIDSTSSLPPMDIKNGAASANLQDAGVFAWQEFIALNWPAVSQTGATNTRDQPDPTVPFGNSTGPLVWHTFRHKVEIFPGMGQPPGYSATAKYFGYDALPQYIYAANATPNPNAQPAMPWIIPPDGQIPSFASLSGPTPAPTGSPSPVPWINLDEQSEIGLDTMFAGTLTSANAPFPGQQILFLAKANRAEYMYVAANKWWGGNAPGAATKSYIANFANNPSGYVEPAPGNTTGPGPTQYVSFPNNVIEVKSAWRRLTAKEMNSGRFYTTTVRYYNSNRSQQVGYIDDVFGLVALHIIQKTPTAPYFIYATFSQADNLLDSNGNCIEDEQGNLRLGPCGQQTTATPAPTAPDEPNITSTPATGPQTPPAVQHLAPQEVSPLTLQTAGQRLFYSNTAPTPLPTPTPPSTATPTPTPTPATTQGIIAVNQREHNIPQCIIDVNTAAHAAIKTYGQQNNNGNPVWLYYKLINVQYQPYDKPPGIVYTGTNPDPSTYYQANEVVETNFILQVFSGQFQGALPSPNEYINTFGLITDYNTDGTTFKNVYYNLPAIVPNSSPNPSPTPTPNSGKAALMGGCMGCHGNAQVAGFDFSFILRNGRVVAPDVAAGPNAAPSGVGITKFRKLLLGK